MNTVKKVCFRCGYKKPLSEYYKHKQMSDGHLNKCKTCTNTDSKKRHKKITSTIEGIEKERARHCEKYHRLNYKNRQKVWDKNKPWKNSTVYKNLNRNLKIEKGYEFHHWCYDESLLTSGFILKTREHRIIHSYLDFIDELLIFKNKETGEILNTKEKHESFIKSLGFKYKVN